MKKINTILIISLLLFSCSKADKSTNQMNTDVKTSYEFDTRGNSAFISNNEDILIIENKNILTRYKLKTGNEVARSPILTSSKDWTHSFGAHLIISDDESTAYTIKKLGNEVQIWNTADLTLKSSFVINEEEKTSISKFLLSPDQNYLVIVFGRSPDAYVWDIKSQKQKHVISTSQVISNVKVSPDSQQVVIHNYGLATIWDLKTGRKQHEFASEEIKIPGGLLGPKLETLDITYLTDNKHLARSTNKQIEIIDKNSFEIVNTINLVPLESIYFVSDIRVDPNLEIAIVLKGKYYKPDQQLQILNINSNEILVDSFEPKKLPENSSNIEKILYEGVQKIGMSADGKYAYAQFGTSPSAAVWESKTGKLLFLGTKNINKITFSHNNAMMTLQRNIEASVYDMSKLTGIID